MPEELYKLITNYMKFYALTWKIALRRIRKDLKTLDTAHSFTSPGSKA